MIYIKIFENQAGEIRGFLVRGHAGYAPKGEDIICAGVSALVQAAVLGLRHFLEKLPQVETGQEENARLQVPRAPGKRRRGGKETEEGVFFKVVLPESLGEKDREAARIILETLEMGLQGIALGYRKYVDIRRCRAHDEV
ncbi:MAG: ribosomal-processing cysteine protease Prp [Bacillota bacterium]|nr:ribosomal-processing cysteine protease Prp [Bacillota bacterium]